jgi:non-ribosomal peptide synthase protein (TIGR01720 family)
MLLKTPEALDLNILENALRALTSHHDALRLRFTNETGSWKQANAGVEAEDIFSRYDMSFLPVEEQQAALKTTIAELQGSLDLSRGPLLRAAHFYLGAGRPGRLLLAVHHLAVDGVSWRILLEDIEKAYADLRRGAPVSLPPKTTSFQEWARSLAEYARSVEVEAEASFWLSVLDKPPKRIPVDFTDGCNTEGSARMVTTSLSVAETQQLLHEVPAAYNTQINDVLLTALSQTFSHWTGDRALLVDLEGHGREEIIEHVDISRTVGWFTSLFPVLLAVEPGDRPGEALKAIKEQLRRIPNHGVGYGVLRFLSGETALSKSLQTLPQAAIQFNYLGQFNQLFSGALFEPAAEPPGAFARVASPNQRRPYLLEILGIVVHDELRMIWLYSESVHRHSTVEALANVFMESLRVVIEHCCTRTRREFTPSDFPLANLSQAKLDKIAAKLQRPAPLHR